MCTVTIIPKGLNDFVLTSNRDEAPNRESLAPELKIYKDVSLLYPEDKLSSGTWIGVSEQHRTLCLLNGGFELHRRQAPYRQSRGVVVKDLLACTDVVDTIETYNFSNIEPFTLVIVDYNVQLCFYELVWDGTNAHFKQLAHEPHIWSSATLYTQDMKAERQQWFTDFKAQNALNADTLLNFHKTAGADIIGYGVIMDRGVVKTTSITQVEKTVDSLTMRYESLKDTSVSIETFKSPQIINE